ncbi:MAG: anti-sigma factor (plasmid) [Leptolyngbya sp. BL-A-14]
MTEPLTPETIATLAAGYVVGDLDHAEIEAFEQLLATNPALVAEVAELQTTLAQVVHGLNSVAPPPHLQAAILDAATTKLQPSRRKLSQIPWRTVVGSVAALLILGLGVDNYRLRQDARLNQEVNALLQQSQTQLFALKPVNTSETAGGSFVVNLEQRQGVLAVQNLVAPPAGKVYRLWAIADGETIPCGTLNRNAQGKVLNKFWMPADFYDTGVSGFFVTLEVSDTSRYPNGTIVMQSHTPTKL